MALNESGEVMVERILDASVGAWLHGVSAVVADDGDDVDGAVCLGDGLEERCEMVRPVVDGLDHGLVAELL